MSPTSDDPYTEPANSTVDDWLGQSVERDRELAERLIAEEDGDLDEAERRFAEESTGEREQRDRLHPEREEATDDPSSPGATLLRDDLDQAEPTAEDAVRTIVDVDPTEWDRVVRVNLLGTAAVVRAALPSLVRTRGRVVTVASTLGLRALSDATAYCASKFGVVGLTRALAAELAGRVGVTLLVPGGMATPFFDGRPEQYRPGPDAQLNDPASVADAVLFALTRPPGTEVRELVVCPSGETSWP